MKQKLLYRQIIILFAILVTNKVFYAQNTNPITLDENNILYYNGAAQVDLSQFLDNSDEQVIWRDSHVVGIKNGGEVDISDLKDNTDDQFMFKFGNTVFLEDGSQFSLEQYLDNTDAQQISAALDNNTLNVSIDNGNTVAVNLSSLVEPTQNLTKDLMLKLEALTERVEALEQCACYASRKQDENKSSNESGKSITKQIATTNPISFDNQSKLYQNIPNPFQNTSSITYYIPETSKNAQLKFSSTSGKLVSQIDIADRGKGQLDINAAQLASGVYLYSLVVDGHHVATRKMVVQ